MISRPRLRSILLGVNLVVLIVPVLGIAGLRIYETELIRRTEAEVIAQAAFIKAEAEREFATILQNEGLTALPEGYGFDRPINWPVNIENRLRPIDPILSSSRGPILDPERPPAPPRGAPDAWMAQVGERLEPTMLEAQKTTLSGMNVVDWRGNVVATTSTSQRNMALYDREEVIGALDGEIVRLLRRRDAIPEHSSLQSLSRETSVRVSMSIPIVFEGQIIGAATVWRTPQSLPKAIYENRAIFALLVGMMLLSGLTMAAMTSFYIGRPIQRLIAQTERIARDESDGARPIDNPGTFEVQQLSESIAEMAKVLAERADYIRTFARSVSHEFKTPLTSIRGTVELLQDHYDEMSDSEREDFLDILDKEARRLDHLVGRLLELARADVERSADDAIDVLPVLEKVARAHERDDFAVHLQPGDLPPAAINEEALRAALANLLVNARQHGGDQVQITLTCCDETLTITIADNGPGISQGNATRVFDDFFTTARDTGGTGLGLSITRTLLQAHGGTIELLKSETGAAFAITLRRA